MQIFRRPDFVIGRGYLHRWWLIPRNRFFNIYLHLMLGPDDDRALHDHPWFNISFLIRGRYMEVTPKGVFRRVEKQFVFRSPWSRHRIIPITKRVRTLFITGPIMRTWGFWCPQGFIRWKDFVAEDPGQVGKGCDQ